MTRINTLKDYFQLFEEPGWKKTCGDNSYTCRAGSDIGKGSVKIYGDINKFCYIKTDFYYNSDNIFLFSIEEPYIEISNNLEDSVILEGSGTKDLIADRGLKCLINLGNLKVTQLFPAKTRFWKESLIIREDFLRAQMPAFIENKMFHMTASIQAGGIADPRIALLFKQMNTFPLDSGYGKVYMAGKVYEALALLQDKADQVQWDKITLTSVEIDCLKNAILFMKNNYHKQLRISDLTKQFALNRNKLQIGFHTLTGYTVHEYLLNIRVQEATTLLINSNRTISEIAENVGFKNAKSLYDAFFKFLGIPPNQLRNALH